ncbi:MAG: histidine ammonia-lyase [Nanoarchaeota archaeon]|nr:histidine ammonia-lyase [Nanoarchaeota archaeon]
MDSIVFDGFSLSINDLVLVSRNSYKIILSDDSKEKINEARASVESFVDSGKVVYGLTTGFGALKNKIIDKNETAKLQENIILSHAAGVGNFFSEEISRAIMLLRVNTFAKGNSGIRLKTVELLVDMLNNGVHPAIPEKGSVGSSGDLAPLSHMGLVMLGKGEAFFKGELLSGGEALKRAGLSPIVLSSKEGLAITNGTPVMTAVGALAVFDAEYLLDIADIAGALSLEAVEGVPEAFDKRIHEARPHSGQLFSAKNLRNLIYGSKLVKSCDVKVQNSYSLRCMPQVHGASRDAINYIKSKVEIELNSATDNPLIFDGDVLCGGNFHGQPMALSFDFLGIAVAELANISERRTAKLVDPNFNNGLPAFLVKNSGLNSGFMIPQYSAAALVSENKVLAHPASVDSIPTCANQEDHVSMGTIAARKARDIVENSRNVLAIELLTACQAIDFRDLSKISPKNKFNYDVVRSVVSFMEEDRELYLDMNNVEKLIKNHKFKL